MNWIKVVFDGMRTVFADGKELGETNKVLYLGESGTYDFSLGGPGNYRPLKKKVQVSGTTRQHPLVIEFTKE
ncbi:MAG: PEGA domain-containing protein [Proteobacteria bacterium]|nr:PEGA domain-containing protein [Pseudomonadota bacterium]MBU1715407.1 PEGA domain-containing protein [Pseudomonadota bacterium]